MSFATVIAIIGILVAFGAFSGALALTERRNHATWKEFE